MIIEIKSNIDNLTYEERKNQQYNKLHQIYEKIEFKTIHSLKDCIEGLFSYIQNVSKQDFSLEVEIEGKKIFLQFKCPKLVKISNNLFRNYSCISYGCSKCCHFHGFINIFSNNEYNLFKEKYPHSIEYNCIPVIVNGVESEIYTYNHTKEYCNHLSFKQIDSKVSNINGCSIHEFNPLHCAFPLIKFKRVKNITYITRETFGRNKVSENSLRCPVEFSKNISKDDYNYTIFLLKRLQKMSNEYKIETHLETIIDEVERKYKMLIETNDNYF